MVAGVRYLRKFLKLESNSIDNSDLHLPPKHINKFLSFLFASERHLMNLSLPFGVSILLVAHKNK
jgi:hypothetical protein